MLIEFRVENHRSLRDEQALTLEAANLGNDSDWRPRAVAGHDGRLLPAVVLYGANASGKSNVLSSLAFMRDAVLQSHRFWEPDTGVPRSPFGWGPKSHEPSTFEVSFLLEDKKYLYGFVVGDTAIEEEWLYAWPHGRKQVWLQREGSSFIFGEHFGGQNEVIREVTRENALFLSAASQHQHPILSSIYSWFRRIVPVNLQGRGFAPPSARGSYRGLPSSIRNLWHPVPTLFEHEWPGPASDLIRQLLLSADTGIVDLKIEEEEETTTSKRVFRRERILLKHNADDDNSWLDYEEESQGTKTIIHMAIPLLRVLGEGGVLLIDELESSLHPLLGLKIVEMFNAPATNPLNSQIIFTTHDTNLLGTTLGKPALRRDQIWFTEKDKEGASQLYPLTNFKPRNSENLERGYLQGRYGAIPFLGNPSWTTE